jgi:SAM-dependent methyltransferase
VISSGKQAVALTQARSCPVCASATPADLIEIPAVPVYCNVLWPRREEALRAKRGPISLKHCGSCGHLFNASYDGAFMDYTAAYDSSLHFSPHFSRYAEELARRLVERYALRGRKVVEIGCGKGDFLVLLCEQGGNRGWGFDRSFDPARVDAARRERIAFSQEFYTAGHAARLRPDFVCFRHVLEHVADPRDFLEELRRGFGDRTDAALYCEVPNALFTLRDLGIWDLIYEHCAYFTLGSLARAAGDSGFDVLAMGEAFGGQYLYVEMRPGKGDALAPVPEAHGAAAVRTHASAFARQYGEKVEYWRARLREMQQAGRRTLIWGGGSKGVTFLNVLGGDSGIEYVVDLNPYKQGQYVAGTGQRVVAPEFLREFRPTDVIVMNPVYEAEIAASVRALGLDARLHRV